MADFYTVSDEITFKVISGEKQQELIDYLCRNGFSFWWDEDGSSNLFTVDLTSNARAEDLKMWLLQNGFMTIEVLL